MSETRSNTPSVADRTRAVATGGPVIAIHFLGDCAVFILGEEAAMLVAPDGGLPQRLALHSGGILSSAGDGKRIVTGGDDGKVMEIDAKGATREVFADPKKKWIDHVALGPDGAIAWSAGKLVQVAAKKEAKQLELPSTAGGLAFAPKGFRLAIAHYNGASLWFPNAQAKPEFLEWKGSHLGVTMSPDGRFLVTTMQESMLHGWRLVDGKHMRMSGYAARVRSFGWTSDGEYLATGGSDQLILWPFGSKDGPMGKQPTLLAPHGRRLEVVACHPKQPVVAAGYEDGLVLLVRLGDGAEVLVHPPELDTPVTALGWSADGAQLAFACEDRSAGVVDLA